VIDHGIGVDDNPPARLVGPPAEVHVVPHEGQVAVEAAQAVPHVAADQHAGAADREDRALPVMLSLVLLIPVEAGLPATRRRDRQTCLEDLPRVVPAKDLRPDHPDLRVVVR
jgi:hypothetical protein